MSTVETARWLDYDFRVCGPPVVGAHWPVDPGLYVFAGEDLGGWFPIYVGQSDSFCKRLPNHDKWQAATQLGATHVHILPVDDPDTRGLIEYRFYQQFGPPLNDKSPPTPPLPRFS